MAVEEGSNSSSAAVLRAGQALDVHCSCGEAFCLCCGGAPHEPAPCAAVSCPASPVRLKPCTLAYKLITCVHAAMASACAVVWRPMSAPHAPP